MLLSVRVSVRDQKNMEESRSFQQVALQMMADGGETKNILIMTTSLNICIKSYNIGSK